MKLLKIGSSPSCDIVLNSEFVSAHHAELTILDNGELILEDKNSTNGTFVGNKKINSNTEVTVRRGDYVRFADTDLVWARVPAAENNSKYKAIINIGSNFRNDLVLNSGVVSRFHATLKVDKKNKVFLKDNNSKNGTQVNGVKIQGGKDIQIKRGDNIICGGEDITEQVKQFIPGAPFNQLLKITGVGLAAAAVLGLVIGVIMTKVSVPDPELYRPAVVYIRAGYHYEVTLEDYPLSDNFKVRIPLEEEQSYTYQATAFFIDRDGRMATNRHVALPWAKEYRNDQQIEEIKQVVEQVLVNAVPVGRVDTKEEYTRLLSTPLGRALDKESRNLDDLNAKINRLKKSPIHIEGKMDFMTVGYPGRYYTHYDEFERCNVLCESGTADQDIALLQLNTKKTPKDIECIFDVNKFILGKIQPLKDDLSTIGYPNGIQWGMDEKSKSLEPNIRETKCSKVPSKYEFEFQESSVGGSSGSPVFKKDGCLVGILCSGYNGAATMAVQARFLKEMYEKEVGL